MDSTTLSTEREKIVVRDQEIVNPEESQNNQNSKLFKTSNQKDALSKLKEFEPDQTLTINNLTQFTPRFDEIDLGDIKEFDKKVFQCFIEESQQVLDLNDFVNYSGHMDKGQKEGDGGNYDKVNQQFYYGGWNRDQKFGYGICFYNVKQIKSKEKYISWSYDQVYKGYWNDNQRSGLGFLKNLNGDIILANFERDKIKDSCQVQIKYLSGDIYIGQIKNEKRQGYGLYLYVNGDEYHGNWGKNLKQGKGKIIFQKGGEFAGTFENDDLNKGYFKDHLRNVFTSLEYSDEENEKLNGYFLKGKLYNYGKAEYANKEVYKGMFKDGKRCGLGKMTYLQYNEKQGNQETSEYDGEWRLNMRHGKGIQKWSDGSIFEGVWNMDRKVIGKMQLTDRSVYQGPFNSEKFHGIGELFFPDQNVFKGLFENGNCHKFGMMTYKDKRVYIGEMLQVSFEIFNKQCRDYRMEGIGCLIQINGDTYEGEFVNDQATGVGQVFYQNGDYYIGQLEEYKKQGAGRFYEKMNRRSYFGRFYQDKKEGDGYYFYDNGQVYCGNFKNNLEEGVGEYIDKKDLRDLQDFQDQRVKDRINYIEKVLSTGQKSIEVDRDLFRKKIVIYNSKQ
ncbi:phosphatidylinositol-4-phosphate 5- [Stylonychia lemnae]|uniref:Phosphatidylinositol-4-phosphate 5 n=1 Tax=Stylonychia lemnae TaxID=5949 RepID=A0A078AQX8_STYLE|nr:phosphatidylinositol-4-phosphate 5- [Stylonychia lemnae]|eukprot:CDW84351.1 phosphatidylinositol-4-phosphate 5- [Stylonychia lemnae]